MTNTQSSKTELLRPSAVREILRAPGPCITILLPSYRPGESTGSSAALLKSYIRDASHELSERGFGNSAKTALLEPLEACAEAPALAGGTQWGHAIFRSPNVFERFALTQTVQESLAVGSSFEIRKLAKELARPHSFYILALSKAGVSLMRCAGLHAEVVKLPPGIPDTLAGALALKPPDHDLENRSAAGVSAGAMRGVRFGTGSERETKHAHLADYYRLVDRGLRTAFQQGNDPLILAGVAEDTAIYEDVSCYAGLAKRTIPGSHDFSRDHADILKQAYSILECENDKREHAAMEEALKRATPGHFLTDPEMILRAAFEGRVHQLYINVEAERIGIYQRDTYQSWGNEDLLNLAAVQTMIHRGQYCEIPNDVFPNGGAAIGILRF